jgi:hypothetical protein
MTSNPTHSAIFSDPRRKPRAIASALSAALLAALLLAASAHGAAPERLFRLEAEGGGAGELSGPTGIAVDPSAKRLYVTESNNRISEYTVWGAFVRAWGWGVADGAAELQVCGPSEPELAPPPSLCRGGLAGVGRGQMKGQQEGITVDGAGDLWVADLQNHRLQEFSPTGQFLLMVGGKVNATKVGEGAPSAQQNLCPVDPGDVCQAGTVGSAPGYFADIFEGFKPPDGAGFRNSYGNYIAYSSTADAILVGDKDRIQVFNLDGSLREAISFQGELAAFHEKPVIGLATDSAGDIYLVVGGLDDVYKLSPAGVPLDPGKPGASKFALEDPKGVLAVDDAGDVYGSDRALNSEDNGFGRVLEFDAAGNQLLPTSEEEAEALFFPYLPYHAPSISGLAANRCPGQAAPGNLYLTSSSLYGYGTPPIACEPPPSLPPDVTAQYATAVNSHDATLRAEINPRFWPDATYYLEYGTGKCSATGCPSRKPLAPGSLLTPASVNAVLKTADVVLTGLSPGTTYHYRFVAQSGGGGPVYGVDPDATGPAQASFADGLEGTFRTFSQPSIPPACPANEALRTGPSAALPDCRAYELVSPLDKGGGDAAFLPATQIPFELNSSSTSGDRFTYASMTPFAQPESAPYIAQYLAGRDPQSGWHSESISPPRTSPSLAGNLSLNNEYKAFTPDLCTAWLRHNSKSTLSQDAVPGYPNLYQRQNCGSTGYEALSTGAPPTRPAKSYDLNLEGYADQDPSRSIFVAADALTPDAPVLPELGVGKEFQLYEHTPGGLHFICHLPDGTPYTAACAPGMAAGEPDDNAAAVQNAISADGSKVFWTAYKDGLGTGEPEGLFGKIYLRQNSDQPQSKISGTGKCSEPAKACTIAVSESVTPEPAQYWAAADDGSKAIFRVKAGPLAGNLYEFDVATKTPHLIAGSVESPMGISEDASRVYFASTKVLGEGASEGAKAGAHNLYLYEAPEKAGEPDSFTFIMALSASDLLNSTEGHPGPVFELPNGRSSVLSADGLHAAFTSSAPAPTGYDNRDAESGQLDQEVYLYDAAQHRLLCVSCNPTGARPRGVVTLQDGGGQHWSAARLPARSRALLNFPRPLSTGSDRLFFESHEALVPGDSNGTWDVYEWEAPGTGTCTEASSTYGEASGGCVELISSGQSPQPAKLLDADPSGSNVFIGTQASLIPADPGLNDVYDARIGGGFAEPTRTAACEGEACQGPLAPPNDPTPASSSFEGAGNVTEKPAKKKHKAQKKRKHAKHHKRAGRSNHKRGAGR